MTATEGGPALHGAYAAPAGDAAGAPVTARSRARGLRTMLGLARVEASMLVRSPLVLAGLLASGAVVWLIFGPTEPLWWNAAWQIGFGQLVLGMAVLVAAQLAAGRARRDAMADLYASFPATAGTRTAAHLISLVGAAPASLVLIGSAAAVAQARGAIGAPSITLLAGGVLLAITAGAAGIAIATRFPHPLAGVLGALVLLLSSGTSHAAAGAAIWLLPWEGVQDQLGSLPGPLAGYPPVGGHVLELAGIAVLAGAVALAMTVGRARVRGALATAGILAVVVICLAGALQLRPIPTADLNHLVGEAADPASVQHCTTANQVRYCLYPGFGRQLPALEVPVSAVLAHLPARPDQPLTLRQVLSPTLDSTLTNGHPKRQVSQWQAQLQRAPGTAATASVIYLPVGSWPAAGARLADARFDVALSAAEWAVRIPPTAIGNFNTEGLYLQCVPLNQAREAIAIWLAILAVHPSASELQDGLGSSAAAISNTALEVRNTFVATWAYPGSNAGYLGPSEAGPATAAGYLLARVMTSLPEPTVARVLTDGWGRWLNWRTTDAQLAAALGIRMPGVPAPPAPPRPPGVTIVLPQNPLCTA